MVTPAVDLAAVLDRGGDRRGGLHRPRRSRSSCPSSRSKQETGFARSLDDARQWSAFWRSYLASGAHAHAWMLPLIGDCEPGRALSRLSLDRAGGGGHAVALGRRGSVAVGRTHRTAVSGSGDDRVLYGSVAMLTLWASLGPRAGLYTVLYTTIPVFSFLRAPERMGIVVMLCLAIFAAFAVRELAPRGFRVARTAIAVVACAAALFELNDIPFDWRPPTAFPPVYRALASMPRGPVAEFPFYDRRTDFHIHTRYMLNSTAHWQPLAERLQRPHPRGLPDAGAGSGDIPVTARASTR